MEVWTGFVIGLLGSVHCVGMCGPIVLALPGSPRQKLRFWVGRLFNNFGRIITYGFLGLLAGLVGKSIHVSGYQQMLSITIGIAILFSVILPTKLGIRLFPFLPVEKLKFRFKQWWGILLRRHSVNSMFLIGLLNGFLPCGFVYLGLAGALSTGTVIGSIGYMALFGLGTMPILLATSWLSKLIGIRIRQTVLRLFPVGMVILALLFILRGMSLGIPYVSPKIVVTGHETSVECCH